MSSAPPGPVFTRHGQPVGGVGFPPPEAGRPRVAGLGPRAIAFAIDTSVVGLASAIPLFVVFVIAAMTGSEELRQLLLQVVPTLIVVPGLVVYFGGAFFGEGGRTFGRKSQGLWVANVDGTPASTGTLRTRAAVRFGPGFAAALLAAPVVGESPVAGAVVLAGVSGTFAIAEYCLAPVRGERRRTVSDRIAGTVVVQGDLVIVPPVPRPVRSVTRLVPVLGTLGCIATFATGVYAAAAPEDSLWSPARFSRVAAISESDGSPQDTRDLLDRAVRKVEHCLVDASVRACDTPREAGLPPSMLADPPAGAALGIWMNTETDKDGVYIDMYATDVNDVDYGVSLDDDGVTGAACFSDDESNGDESDPCNDDPATAAWLEEINGPEE